MIIDSHTHVDESPVLGWSDPPEVIVRLLDEAQISRAVIMTYRDAPGPEERVLEYVAEAVQKYPDRLIAYARMNPRFGDEAVELFDRSIREYGMRGLKLHPVGYVMHPTSEQTLNLIRHAAELNVPTLFHCGDEEFTMPLQIAEAAAMVPDAKIILGHMGGYFHVKDAIRVAKRHPNLILETSAMPYPGLIKEAVEGAGGAPGRK
jgi:predicted TIM-barrel fold metal-dependent hydrolase